MAAELAVVAAARDQAQEQLDKAKVAAANLRSTIEAEVTSRSYTRIQELARTLERERTEKEEKDRLLREGADEHARQIREAEARRTTELTQQREVLDKE